MPLNMSRPPVEEVIHGVVVSDPYRWLEDRGLPDTEESIAHQQRRCEEYFADCGDLDGLRSRVREYLDVEVVDQPAKVAGRYFYRRRDPGQEQGCIYMRDTATGHERLLVDPSALGPFASVGIHSVSEDGSLLAYELKHGGEDKKAIHIVDAESGLIFPDNIETGYARGFAFTSDQRGFYYCHERSAASEEHMICLHLFHESVEDQVVFRVARSRESRLVLTADTVHLGATWIHPHASELLADFWVARHDEPTGWRQVFTNRQLPYSPILRRGQIFALSYDDAPNGKLLELSYDGGELRTIIPEQDAMIQQLVIVGDRIFTRHLHYFVPSIRCWNLAGKNWGRVNIPIDGTIQLLPNQNYVESSLFYTYESFIRPPVIFEYLPNTEKSRLWHRRPLPARRTPCHPRRMSYPSRDGTQIPMTLVARNENDLGLEAPVIMTSYGGFGVPMTPQFSVLVSIMMESGVVFALPHVRGGGDFGKAWHDAGRVRNRQTSFDDFIAAAEWLCDEGITSSQQLAIFGGSNSGLLVGAAMTQRPGLFQAVLCIAPLLDMVRYEHFDQATKWRKEYGTVADLEEFRALYAYSPYHRIEDTTNYPSVMFVSGEKDDRCNPAHVRKMAARMQQRDAQKSPIVVDYSEQRGHSPALPLSVRIEALVRRIDFLCKELNIPVTPGGSHETSSA
jgi:prolyl oligopeptidase